jgi:hypothetical protein
MSEYVNSEAPWQEVAGPAVAPSGVEPVADPMSQVDINRIRDDYLEDLNRGTDFTTVPIPGVRDEFGRTAEVTVPLPWSESRRREQAARLERWGQAQDRLGARLLAGRAAELRRELADLTEEGRQYARQLLTIPTDEDANTYTYETYSHPLDDLDNQRHRGDGSWTQRVSALRRRLEAFDSQLDLDGYEVARDFYRRNPAAAQAARDMLFGGEEIELGPEFTAADFEVEPLEMNQLVHRTQKMIDEREKVRRSLYERDMIRTDGTPIDPNTWTALKNHRQI